MIITGLISIFVIILLFCMAIVETICWLIIIMLFKLITYPIKKFMGLF